MKALEFIRDLIEAFKALPPLGRVNAPIRQILKVVRADSSFYQSEAKSLKKTL